MTSTAAITLALVAGLFCATAGLQAADSPPDDQPVVLYHDFGAVGDGKTNDFDAIIAAHAHANQRGLPVRARDGATYYIGKGKRTAVIRTDTDFGTAAFIVDDNGVPIEERGIPVFTVASDHQPVPITGITALRKGQTQLGTSLATRSLVVVTEQNRKRFIRRGANRNAGDEQQDVVLVEADGTIDSATPLLWDFDAITTIRALPVDAKPLTLRGGHFTTIANQAPSAYTYYSRSIRVARSNVTIEGLTHLVTGEGDTGAPYLGFIAISQAANVVVRQCVLTTRKTYSTIGAAGSTVAMGSYDLTIEKSVNVSLVGCTQSNDIHDSTRWSIMGSSYCKNLLYDGCTLSRFDAHRGLYNGTIRNSTVKHVALTGWGTFRIENSTIANTTLVNLRSDYGSIWDGDLVIRDCILAPPGKTPGTAIAILSGSNDGQHDFGYPCRMPGRIDIDGLRVLDSPAAPTYAGPVLLRAGVSAPDAPFPYARTRQVITKRVTAASGLAIRLSDTPDACTDTGWEHGD